MSVIIFHSGKLDGAGIFLVCLFKCPNSPTAYRLKQVCFSYGVDTAVALLQLEWQLLLLNERILGFEDIARTV